MTKKIADLTEEQRKKLRAYQREYANLPENKERKRKAQAKHRSTQKHREKHRDDETKRRHGITRAEVDAMIEAQNGLCAICNRLPRGARGASRLNVDHDHKTGKIRKMLCAQCNRAIGLVGENVKTLRGMIDYLMSYALQ